MIFGESSTRSSTVTIQRGPHVTERINIRRLVPFRE